MARENAAAGFQKKFNAIADSICIDSNSARGKIASLTPDRVILPVSLKPYELRFHDVSVPDPTSIYPLLKKLHALGLRTFELFSFGGSRLLEIPHVADEYHDRHKGRRCFVVGNGPSLNQIDMTRLRDEITIGANRCYLGYPKWGFHFNYWCVVDQLQVEDYGAGHVAALPAETPKFYPLEYLTYLQPPNGCPVNLHYGRRPDFTPFGDSFYRGHTVVTLMLQLAVLMGCDPIVLVGVDHSYNLKGSPLARNINAIRNRLVRSISGSPLHAALAAFKRAINEGKKTRPVMWQAADAASPTHFDDAYTSERKRFQMPNPGEVERDMRVTAAWAREHGVTILNATPGTKLQAFKEIDFAQLF
ncbi:hypothetical protein LLG95_11495 [bacterium]|nr:hypothetical protein [bacterium]